MAIIVTVVIVVATVFSSNTDFAIAFGEPNASTAPSATVTPSPTAALNVTTVATKDNYYVPANLTVNVGTTVVWTNEGTDIHTATSYATGPGGTGYIWNSGILNPKQSYNYTFTQTGTFNYFCGVHPTIMFGQVVVIPKT